MDTRSIAGVYQRFFTPLLHQQLHTHYFRTLTMIIINRSEIVATERRQMLLFEMTRRNEAATAVRERDLQKTWRKRIRQDYMRLFRSELGKKIFGRSQRKVLAEVFRGWVRYWSWHRGHKQAFELKYAVIKHGVDLRRLHPKVLGLRLPGRVTRDDDVPTLEGYDKRVDTKPSLVIEAEPEPEPEVDHHADDPLDSPETRRKKENMRAYLAEQVRAAASVCVLRRLSRFGTSTGTPSPRGAPRRRRLLDGVTCTPSPRRLRDGVPSTPTPSPRRHRRATAAATRHATASLTRPPARRPRTRSEDWRRRPRTRRSMVLDLLKSWMVIEGSRRIERRIEPGAAWRTRPAVYQWNVFLVVLETCLISSRRKLEAGNLLPRTLKRRASSSARPILSGCETGLLFVKPAARPTPRPIIARSRAATIRVSIEWRVP